MYINGQPCGGAFFRGERIFDATPKDEPFYVEDISGSANTLSIAQNDESAPTITVEKSTDGITWESMGTTSTTAITAVIPAYGKLYLRASATRWYSTNGSYYNTITASKRHNVGGNILSLLHGSTFTGYTRNLTSTNTYAFASIFRGNTNLVSAEKLILNTTLAERCYRNMFYNCTSLTTVPELPATTLAESCYRNMFYNCTSLTTVPELPATTLASDCYRYMFASCLSLTTVPSDLLPATTLASNCYRLMFQNCSTLTTAPVLPATTLVESCYYQMFNNCSLTTAPELPATTLAVSCYYQMFKGCTSLTTVPELPATTLVESCYYQMFNRCTHLNYIKCLATNISASGCLNDWVSGVAASGTFIKDANMTSWPTGNNGIPSGWTVQDAA